jgi:hypothetical protein
MSKRSNSLRASLNRAHYVPTEQASQALRENALVADYHKLQIAIRKSVGYVWLVRVVLTLIIVGYVAVILSIYTRAPEDDEATRRNAEFSHKVLFGEQGVILLLFYLWILTVLIVASAPLLLHVLHRLGIIDKNAKD